MSTAEVTPASTGTKKTLKVKRYKPSEDHKNTYLTDEKGVLDDNGRSQEDRDHIPGFCYILFLIGRRSCPSLKNRAVNTGQNFHWGFTTSSLRFTEPSWCSSCWSPPSLPHLETLCFPCSLERKMWPSRGWTLRVSTSTWSALSSHLSPLPITDLIPAGPSTLPIVLNPPPAWSGLP